MNTLAYRATQTRFSSTPGSVADGHFPASRARCTGPNLETYCNLLRHYRSEHQAAGRCQAGLDRLRTRMARRGWLLSPEALRNLVDRDFHTLRQGAGFQNGSCRRESTRANAARNSS